MRKTKIVATLGPSTDNPDVLRAMLNAGMDVARFNFSHGSHEEHKGRVEMLRNLCNEMGLTVAMLADTQGPEIRLGKFKDGRVELSPGDVFTLTTDNITGDSARSSVTYPGLSSEVAPGNRILLD
ncbi:MAG: pyruvate kinase, partial [Oscillospiraceae bacterium]|nr:pyruvate kinase [Oscillospiraceae bacterium]